MYIWGIYYRRYAWCLFSEATRQGHHLEKVISRLDPKTVISFQGVWTPPRMQAHWNPLQHCAARVFATKKPWALAVSHDDTIALGEVFKALPRSRIESDAKEAPRWVITSTKPCLSGNVCAQWTLRHRTTRSLGQKGLVDLQGKRCVSGGPIGLERNPGVLTLPSSHLEQERSGVQVPPTTENAITNARPTTRRSAPIGVVDK